MKGIAAKRHVVASEVCCPLLAVVADKLYLMASAAAQLGHRYRMPGWDRAAALVVAGIVVPDEGRCIVPLMIACHIECMKALLATVGIGSPRKSTVVAYTTLMGQHYLYSSSLRSVRPLFLLVY